MKLETTGFFYSARARTCVSLILKQLSDASECYYLPQVVGILPKVSLLGQLII